MGNSSDFVQAKESDVSEKLSRAAVGGIGGGLLGAGIGAGIGALVGRSNAVDAYEDSIEATQVELSWEEPVMDSTVIGQIPKDERLWPSVWNHLGLDAKPSRINPDMENVLRTNPVFDDRGQPEMRTRTEVFEGYGTPDVNWASHRIINQDLTGYDRDVTSRYEGQWGCHRNWLPPEDKELVEWCVDYKPKISRTEVGTYKTPEVDFERPDNVNKQISSAAWSGAAKGAGIGFSTGLAAGVLGSLLIKSMDY